MDRAKKNSHGDEINYVLHYGRAFLNFYPFVAEPRDTGFRNFKYLIICNNGEELLFSIHHPWLGLLGECGNARVGNHYYFIPVELGRRIADADFARGSAGGHNFISHRNNNFTLLLRDSRNP